MKCFNAPREFLRDLMDAMGEGVEETGLRGCVTWVGKDSGRVEVGLLCAAAESEWSSPEEVAQARLWLVFRICFVFLRHTRHQASISLAAFLRCPLLSFTALHLQEV